VTAWYNEIDPHAAQWLRNLIARNHIAPGDVDERDIRDVHPDDLRGYTQCHFFAGIGVWSLALRRAGWPDTRPVWTGSCPCQPFSPAGKGGGFDDERHLWPDWHHLIRERRPAELFGEQVAGKNGTAWFDLVSADMEADDYAIGAIIAPAAGFGAPQIRERQYWAACDQRSAVGQLDHGGGAGLERYARNGDPATGWPSAPGHVATSGTAGPLGDAVGERFQWRRSGETLSEPGQIIRPEGLRQAGGDGEPGAANGLWADADWLLCRDGKWRPVEPGTFPLAHGAASRVGRLRAYGNSLCLAQAEGFVADYMECDLIELKSNIQPVCNERN